MIDNEYKDVISIIRPCMRLVWSEEQLKELKRLREKGHNMDYIAEQLGMSRNQVNWKLINLRKEGKDW